MGVYIDGNKLLMITEPKTIHFKKNDKNLKYEIAYILLKYETFRSTHNKKVRLVDYCPNICMETIFVNTENNKTNEPHKFVLNLKLKIIAPT